VLIRLQQRRGQLDRRAEPRGVSLIKRGQQ
jgi:hypothetical protein